MELFNKCRDESNVLVVVGDKGFNSEWADSTLVDRLVENNCRLLGFQLYGGEPDNFNNFVLQIGNMIDCSAPRISRKKRELIVYPEQLRNGNEYAEVNHNTYCLDFPNRSMTQGWLVFPQKNESLELEGLTTAVDSMLLQVKFDNTLLGNSLTRAFEEVGTHRYKLDSTLVDYYHIRRSGVQPILSVLPGIEPGWKLPAEPVVLPDSLSSVTDYYLLVNEEEFKRLRKYVEVPAKLVLDYKYEAVRKKKQAKTDICNCPDDYLPADTEEATIRPDAPCEKATGKASAFGTQQGQVLQDGKKGFPEHAFVGSVATVHIVSCGLSVLRGLPGQGLAEKGDDYGCGTGRAD